MSRTRSGVVVNARPRRRHLEARSKAAVRAGAKESQAGRENDSVHHAWANFSLHPGLASRNLVRRSGAICHTLALPDASGSQRGVEAPLAARRARSVSLARKLARQAPPVLIQSRLWRTLRCVSNLADAEPLLRGASLRVTQPRLAVLSAVQEHPHTDTDTLIAIVRAQLGAVSHQAVYDVLRVLTGAGLVRRIQPSGSVARFEARVVTTTITSCAGPAARWPMWTALWVTRLA